MSLFSLSPHALSGDPYYPRLKDYVIANTGLAYYSDKDEQFASHAVKRIAQLALPDCGSYLRLLQSDEVDALEMDRLIAVLTIGETFFFRHREAFDALRDVVLPDVIRRNQGIRKLRIWSAASCPCVPMRRWCCHAALTAARLASVGRVCKWRSPAAPTRLWPAWPPSSRSWRGGSFYG